MGEPALSRKTTTIYHPRKKEKGPSPLWALVRVVVDKIYGNYSGAPHLCPFKPTRVAQVRFTVLNEQVRIGSEPEVLLNSYRPVILQVLYTHLNSYDLCYVHYE